MVKKEGQCSNSDASMRDCIHVQRFHAKYGTVPRSLLPLSSMYKNGILILEKKIEFWKNGILKKMEFHSRILILFNSVKEENVLYMEKQVF